MVGVETKLTSVDVYMGCLHAAFSGCSHQQWLLGRPQAAEPQHSPNKRIENAAGDTRRGVARAHEGLTQPKQVNVVDQERGACHLQRHGHARGAHSDHNPAGAP